MHAILQLCLQGLFVPVKIIWEQKGTYFKTLPPVEKMCKTINTQRSYTPPPLKKKKQKKKQLGIMLPR